jgi:hypothetical protein
MEAKESERRRGVGEASRNTLKTRKNALFTHNASSLTLPPYPGLFLVW